MTRCGVKLLREDGPLIRVGHRGAAALAPENTLRSFEVALEHGVHAIEFDEVAVWPALRFNRILLAFDKRSARGAETVADGPAALRPLRELLLRQLRPVTAKAKRPWTDDRAPVEWVTDRMIVKYAARGGELDEDLLPTAP